MAGGTFFRTVIVFMAELTDLVAVNLADPAKSAEGAMAVIAFFAEFFSMYAVREGDPAAS